MATSTPEAVDTFPIPTQNWSGLLRALGQLDDETLPLVEGLHFQNVPEDGPLHYLQEKLPLRPTLLETDRKLDRSAYEAGLWLGSAIIRGMTRTALIDERSLCMPSDSDADRQIDALRRHVVGHRFRLQPLFESQEDMIPVIYRQVEYPWYEHNVRFGVNKGLGEDGKLHDDYVVVGLGDMLALCHVLLLGCPPEERVPLVGTDALMSTGLEK